MGFGGYRFGYVFRVSQDGSPCFESTPIFRGSVADAKRTLERTYRPPLFRCVYVRRVDSKPKLA